MSLATTAPAPVAGEVELAGKASRRAEIFARLHVEMKNKK
jgi:hypothetical protein